MAGPPFMLRPTTISPRYAMKMLDNGVLRFEPLRFRIAQGQVTAKIRLDGNQKPPAGKANINGGRISNLTGPGKDGDCGQLLQRVKNAGGQEKSRRRNRRLRR